MFLGFSEFLDIHQASSAALRFYQIHAMLLTYLSQAKFRLRCMVFSAYIHHPVDRRWRVHRYSPFITFRCIHIYVCFLLQDDCNNKLHV
jgi:hypothetical protein